MVLDAGAGGLTMEGLAARAGVSKALPYLHFRDADGVLIALHQRELDRVTDRVARAISDVVGVDRFAAATRAYVDVVAERGPLLARLRAPGVASARVGAGDRTPTAFLAGLFEECGLTRKQAAAAGPALFGALNGLIESWALGEITRNDVVRTTAAIAGDLVARAARRAPR